MENEVLKVSKNSGKLWKILMNKECEQLLMKTVILFILELLVN